MNNLPADGLPTYAIDFETFYGKDVSIAAQGTWHYLRHPECDIYLASIVGPDLEYVGRPEEAPWDKINDARWIAHNYAFDGAVIERLRELGVIRDDIQPADWNCTANLSVYHSGPRNLLGAAKQLLGIDLDKGLRNWMKGRTWENAVAEGKAEALLQYALDDSKQGCLPIWEQWADSWPEHERWLSQHTIMMGWRGVATNRDLLEQSIETLQTIKWKAQLAMPFFQPDAKGISLVKFYECCRENGVEPPATTAEDDPRCVKWELKHNDIKWVREMRTWRKANVALTKLVKLRDRARPDGTVSFGLKYGGAHTLRWSGEGGFNMQNHNRGALRWSKEHGFETPDNYQGEVIRIDVREHLIPRSGKKFGVVDLSQIEPRVTAWYAGDWEFLKLVKEMSPYEAHARLYMGWDGGNLKSENPQTYSLAKARVLALGYGAGWQKFTEMCRTYGIEPEEVFDLPYSNRDKEAFVSALMRDKKHADLAEKFETLGALQKRVWVNAWLQVLDFRTQNTKILNLWSKLEQGLKASSGGAYEMVLASGRELHYFDVSSIKGEWKARTERGGDLEKFYGGKLCENLVQATARDVFAEGVRHVETGGIPVIFHVHDEVVTEVDNEDQLQEVIRLMSATPAWLKDCPIEADGELADHYKK